MQSPRIVVIYTVAALAIASNWLIFVWAVSINQIVQISLGYFINPLLSVVFGMVVFHERLRRLQWVSVALAAAGVVYLTVALDALPWIALWLAASFGTYGLMKKLAPLGPVQGLTFETGILFIPAAVYLIVEELAGRGAFMHAGPLRNILMLGVGARHDAAAADVCGRRPPHPAVAGRDAAVHQSDAANYDRRDALQRAVYASPARRIRPGLGRAGAVCHRGIRHQAMAPTGRHGRFLTLSFV